MKNLIALITIPLLLNSLAFTQGQDKNQMKAILSQLFEKSVALGDEEYSDEQKVAKWIGNPPATSENIRQAEKRLNVILPEDYKQMLLVANGFPTSNNSVEPSFEAISEVDYYRNYKFNAIDSWRDLGGLDDVVDELEKAILIAGLNDEQQFLIIPPAVKGEHWKYWKFAMWIPGEEEYESLNDYLDSVVVFLDDLLEEK